MDNPRRFLYNGGKDMGGALLADGLLLVLEADDLFALETPLRQMMAGFAAEHGFFCGVSRPYGGRSRWIRWRAGCAVWATSAGWPGSCTCTITP